MNEINEWMDGWIAKLGGVPYCLETVMFTLGLIFLLLIEGTFKDFQFI